VTFSFVIFGLCLFEQSVVSGPYGDGVGKTTRMVTGSGWGQHVEKNVGAKTHYVWAVMGSKVCQRVIL